MHFDLPSFSHGQWAFALLAGLCAGISKAGLTGVGMVTVLLMAHVVEGKASSGAVLPLLIFADIMAAAMFRQEIHWPQLRRLALPVAAGILMGFGVLSWMPEHAFQPVIGWMVLAMLALQVVRQCQPRLTAALPHSAAFLWCAGVLTGASTMIANAAGPVATIYLLMLGMPKREFIATMAWLFLFVNLSKVPFSLSLGLITGSSLMLNAVLLPAVVCGLLLGRWIVQRLPQEPFHAVALVLAAAAAVRLIWFS